MTMTGAYITLTIRSGTNRAYEAECPLLARLAPGLEYALFPKRWDCGPKTFDWLVDSLLDPNVSDDTERQTYTTKIRGGKWDLIYRDAPIQRGDQVPEDRLWPA